MRGEQHIYVVIVWSNFQWCEPGSLQQHRPAWIGQDFLFDLVAALCANVGQSIQWHPFHPAPNVACRMPLFFREELATVGHDQSHVACAGMIDTRIIHFVQNAMADSEPQRTCVAERRADGGLGAGGPARRNAGPAWCATS